MVIAIPLRIGDVQYPEPCTKQYCIYSQFQEIFDALGVVLFPVVSRGQAAYLTSFCDGLLLPGSLQNVNPAYYNRSPVEGMQYPVDEYADDRLLVASFLEADKPILGICAGLQELNVYFGGTLHQKIDGHNLPHTERHSASVESGSFLHSVYACNEMQINSLHTQAIDVLAPGLRPTVIAPDGIIEAVERDKTIAVQWHPEMIMDLHFFRSWLQSFF